MTTYAVRNCSDSREHPIHAQDEGASVFVCPGDRLGEQVIRHTEETIADLARRLIEASGPVCPKVTESWGLTVAHLALKAEREGLSRRTTCHHCGWSVLD